MFRITGDGKSVEFSIRGREEWGDARVSFSFSLGWVEGKVLGSCGGDRISEMEKGVRSLVNADQQELSFINEDGNIDISLKVKPTGKVEVVALAIPDMVGDDRVSFSFEGVLSTD